MKKTDKENTGQESREVDALELSIKTIAEYVKKQLAEMKSKYATKQDFREELAGVRRSIMPSIEKLESRVSELGEESKEKSTEDLERKIEKLERQAEHVQQLKAKHGEFEKKLTDIHTTIGRGALRGEKDAVDAHLRRMAELERRLENMNKILSKGTSGLVLSKLKSEMEERFHGLNKEVEAKLKYVDKRLEEKPVYALQQDKTDEKPIAALRAEVDGLRKEIRNTHEVHEPKDVEQLKERISEMEKTIGSVHTTFEKLKDVKGIEGYKDLVEDVRDLRKALDEESALRTSFDKRISDLSVEAKNMIVAMNRLKHSENIDYKKMQAYGGEKKTEADVDKRIHAEAAKIVTRQLDEFAKVLDKRLPQIATRDDLARLEARLKAAPVRRPFAGREMPVDKRIELLERRVNELVSVIRSFKSPFIVE